MVLAVVLMGGAARADVVRVGDCSSVRVAEWIAAPLPWDGEPGLDIAWATAPDAGPRARLVLDARFRVLVRAGGLPLVAVAPKCGVVALDAGHLGAVARWGYWRYLLAALAALSDGRSVPSFADWPGAPLPGRWRAVFAVAAVGVLALLLVGFWLARRMRPPLLVVAAAPSSPWLRPGMERPLGGFFLFLSGTLLLLGPYLYLTAGVIPSSVQPFPDVDGAWAPVDEVALLFWTIGDLGMTTAFVQRFAALRGRDPAAATAAAQLYVWWQLGAAVVLFILAGSIGCFVLPHTRWALLARVALVRAVMKLPGVFGVFVNWFQATQRFDLALGLDLVEKRVLAVLLPIPCVLAFRAWGRAFADEGFGALLGIAVGQYLSAALAFGLGAILYRRQRLPFSSLFAARFDRSTVVPMVRFGLGVMGGKAPFFVANAVEIALLTTLLPGYLVWLGIRQLLVAKLLFALWFLWPFVESAVPAFAEALAANKRQLARLYFARYLQMGHLYVAVVGALLVGAGRPLVETALSGEWRGVVELLPLALASGVLLPLAWLIDSVQKGAGQSGQNAILLVGEQVIRLVILAATLPRIGFGAVFVASLCGLAWKCVLGVWLVRRRIFVPVWMPWSTVAAPMLAGVAVWGASRLPSLWLPPTMLARAVSFGVAALAAFPVGFFFCGLVGGFTPDGLDELFHGAALAGPMRGVAGVLVGCARVGARLGWRRSPSLLGVEAQREVEELVTDAQPLPAARR